MKVLQGPYIIQNYKGSASISEKRLLVWVQSFTHEEVFFCEFLQTA